MPKRVLVVDDDPVQRRILEETIKRSGFNVATAESGDKALTALKADDVGDICLVLLDLIMPGTDGMAVLSAMRLATGQIAAVHMTFLDPLGPRKLPVDKGEDEKREARRHRRKRRDCLDVDQPASEQNESAEHECRARSRYKHPLRDGRFRLAREHDELRRTGCRRDEREDERSFDR